MLRGVFKELHIVAKALIFLGLLLIGLGLSTVVVFILAGPLFGMDLIKDPALLTQFNDPSVAGLQRFMQFMNSLGIFFFPAIFFAFLVSDNWKQYLSLNEVPQAIFFGLAMTGMILFLPWINLMVSLNSAMHLPEFLAPLEHWMREKEEAAELITQSFLKMPDASTYGVNLVIMALIPALGEEILFRGVLQQQLTYRFGNHHVGIWLSAVLFSAIHLQFFGFFPRMLLGAFFGYMLAWTRSLWIPVFAHFLNNAGAVSMLYFFGAEMTEESIDSFGTTADDWMYMLVSGALLMVLLRFTYRIRVRDNYPF